MNLSDKEELEQNLDLISEGLKTDPKYVGALHGTKRILSAQIHIAILEKTLEGYRQVLKINPEDVEALNNKGRFSAYQGFISLYIGKYHEALIRYQEALEADDGILNIDPQNILALNNRITTLANIGFCFRNLGRHKEALEAYIEVLKIEPTNVLVLNNKGVALYEIGDHQNALKSFDEVLKIEPTNMNALENRAQVLAKEKTTAILPVLGEGVENVNIKGPSVLKSDPVDNRVRATSATQRSQPQVPTNIPSSSYVKDVTTIPVLGPILRIIGYGISLVILIPLAIFAWQAVLFLIGGWIVVKIVAEIIEHNTPERRAERARKLAEDARIRSENQEKIRIEAEQRRQEAWIAYTKLRKEIESMPEYQNWRKIVFERFGRKCAIATCDKTENLEIHHRYKSFYGILRDYRITNTAQACGCAALWDPNNGEPLCKPHHDQTKSSLYYHAAKIVMGVS